MLSAFVRFFTVLSLPQMARLGVLQEGPAGEALG
jgi:hypothetical protein